jgi:DNA-binding transcriptional LysR family regulator
LRSHRRSPGEGITLTPDGEQFARDILTMLNMLRE